MVPGVGLVALGVFADLLQLGYGDGFGHLQLFMVLVGLVLFILSSARKNGVVSRFRSLSLLFLNTLILLALLELLSTLIKKWRVPPPPSPGVEESRSNGAWDAFQNRYLVGWIYRPYILYTPTPDASTGFVTTGPDGFRITPGNEPGAEEDGVLVYCFGGSTIWGWGESDDQTITAHLQNILSDSLECPVSVVNRGVMSWGSTQEMFHLMLSLWTGERPDLVIFYDGLNDFNACRVGQPGETVRKSFVENVLNRRPSRELARFNLLRETAIRSNIVIVVTGLLGMNTEPGLSQVLAPARTEEGGMLPDSLVPMATLETMLGNYSIVRALGAYYDFRCLFVWHPIIFCSDRTVTAQEVEVLDPDYIALLRATWELASTISAENRVPGFVDLSGALDPCLLPCYLDICHLNSTGNRIIADSLASVILRSGLLEDCAGREHL
jgi:lysophospholipase L1-like esterase